MPDREREKLLAKLNKNLFVPEAFEQKNYHREIDRNQRDEFITRDLNSLSWIARLVLWIRSKVRGKSIRDLYVANALKLLKKRISRQSPGLTGFEARDLSPKLAEEIFNVYVLTVPIRDIFQRIWLVPTDLEQMLMTLLEQRIPHVCLGLGDLVPSEVLEDIYSQSGSKSAMTEEITRKLEKYTASIPESIFLDLSKDLLPLTVTKDLVLYPYKAFFQLFNFTPLDEDLNRKTFFKSASAMLCLKHLERLRYALQEAGALRGTEDLAPDVVAYLTEVKTQIESEADLKFQHDIEDEAENTQDEDGDDEVKPEPDTAISMIIKRLVQKANSLFSTLPLEELIRYFMKDPYYELLGGRPELRLKELYVSVLRLRSNAELEKVFPEIRKRVIEGKITDLFQGRNMTSFRNYREYESIDYRTLELPHFQHTRSISLLFNYAHLFYKDYLLEGVQVLERGVLGNNRITRDRLLQHAAAVGEIETRIITFDYSISPDAEDGKLFQRLRFTLAQDRGHRKMYRTLVLQKDREALAIIERGMESVRGLWRVFDEIISSKTESFQTQLSTHYYIKGVPVPLVQILKERRDHMGKFVNLHNQVLGLEKT